VEFADDSLHAVRIAVGQKIFDVARGLDRAELRRCRDVPGAVPRFRVETVPRKRSLPAPANGSTLPIMVGAVIYVRVSTKERPRTRACRHSFAREEYCRRQGSEVLERFHEESGARPTTTPQQRAHPGFPRRAFGRGGSCGQGLIGRWSNARGHLSTEVALGEGATRTRFHITLEIDRPLLVGKFDADVKQPGALSLGVGGAERLHDSVVNVIL
jgi:hypothetical protein